MKTTEQIDKERPKLITVPPHTFGGGIEDHRVIEINNEVRQIYEKHGYDPISLKPKSPTTEIIYDKDGIRVIVVNDKKLYITVRNSKPAKLHTISEIQIHWTLSNYKALVDNKRHYVSIQHGKVVIYSDNFREFEQKIKEFINK